MKNLFKLLLFATVISGLTVSCKLDPMADITKGDWNRERSIVNFKIKGQLGPTDMSGVADSVITVLTRDLSVHSFEIAELNLSYKAKADKEVGELLDFDPATNSAKIVVTSQSGISKEWAIIQKEFEDVMIGTWQVTDMHIMGGMVGKKGVTHLTFNGDRAYTRGNPKPITECDNILTFTMEGVDDKGNAYGEVNYDAGADGLFADFRWKSADGSVNIDLNPIYRRLKPGVSKWAKDEENNTIAIIDAGETAIVFEFIKSGTVTWSDASGKSLVVPDNALMCSVANAQQVTSTNPGAWDDIVKDNPMRLYILIKKL